MYEYLLFNNLAPIAKSRDDLNKFTEQHFGIRSIKAKEVFGVMQQELRKSRMIKLVLQFHSIQ